MGKIRHRVHAMSKEKCLEQTHADFISVLSAEIYFFFFFFLITAVFVIGFMD